MLSVLLSEPIHVTLNIVLIECAFKIQKISLSLQILYRLPPATTRALYVLVL